MSLQTKKLQKKNAKQSRKIPPGAGIKPDDMGLHSYKFPKDTFPKWSHKCINVIHDGIDTDWAKPRDNIVLTLKDGRQITSGDKVVFVNRTFEPYRGIHVFMKAAKEILDACPSTVILMVGKDTHNVSYSKSRVEGGWLTHYKKKMSSEIDWSRIYELGKISHEKLLSIYRIKPYMYTDISICPELEFT